MKIILDTNIWISLAIRGLKSFIDNLDFRFDLIIFTSEELNEDIFNSLKKLRSKS